jgi:AraC family transcriptional regulator of adaptative response / methylphosphotriester-DNA alkyltransferase methyltransferase
MSLQETSRRVAVDRHVIERAFQAVGSTFRHTRAVIRVRCARRLLKTDMPLKAIAIDLGFSSSRAFARFFRKHVGLLPNAFRKRHAAASRAK